MRMIPACPLLLGLSVLLAACSGSETPPARTAPAAAARVAVERVTPASIADTIEAVGTVRSLAQSVLSSKIVAVVVAVHAREGDRVRAGQLLVELDDRDVRAQLQRAEAALREARGALDEAELATQAADRAVDAAQAQQEMAQLTHERYKRLVDRELIAAQDYDEAASRDRVAAAELARAREVRASLDARRAQAVARIASAEAERDNAAVVAGYAKIAAAADGVVVAKSAEVGNLAAPGVPLLTVEAERYRLEASVQESEFHKLRVGQRAEATIDALGRTLSAPIVELVPAADPATRTFLVKIDLPRGLAGLRSGLYGRARFDVGRARALLVPRAALTERGQLESVLVVDDGGVARLRLVRTGRAHGDRVEILAGLTAGDRVVTGGAPVADGQRVEPTQ